MQEEKGEGPDGVSGMSTEQGRMLWAQLSAEGRRVRKEVKFDKESKWREEKVTLLLLVVKGRAGGRENEEERERGQRSERAS